MMQYLIARILHHDVPKALFDCDAWPQWGIPGAAIPSVGVSRETIVFDNHLIPLRKTLRKLKMSDAVEVDIQSHAARMEYLGGALDLARSIFPPPKIETGFGNRHLVINIRTGDIYRGAHPNYNLLPIDFYRRILDRCGLEPVFVGQIEDNEYCDALMRCFPSAKFIRGGPVADFEMLRTSRNILLAVSTFSWMAAWLSETSKRIFLPALGFFNPLDRPDVDLIPCGDARFEIYRFPREIWRGTDVQIAKKISERSDPCRIGLPRLFKAASVLRCWREGRLPEGLSLRRGLSSSLY